MAVEATVALQADEESGVLTLTPPSIINPTLLQEDFYRDQEEYRCPSGEDEGLDDDPPCDYIEDLGDKSDLKVLRKSQARVAYRQNSSLGLFHLFLTKSWFSAMKQWTDQKLASKGKKKYPRSSLWPAFTLKLQLDFTVWFLLPTCTSIP
jgi:hypothetical protein